MADFRLRINYQKLGPLCYLSHLELVRSMERTMRRSGLPYAVSQGFNVHMRHSFSSALPVATASLDEYLDIDINQYVKPHQALAQLQAVALPYLPIIAVEYVGKNTPSLQVSHAIADYRIGLLFQNSDGAQSLLDTLGSTKEIQTIKKNKPKSYQLADYLVGEPSILVGSDADYFATLSITLKSTPGGSIRPSALLAAIKTAEQAFEISSITRISLTEVEDSQCRH